MRSSRHQSDCLWRRRESSPIADKNLTGWRHAISDASGCRVAGYRSLPIPLQSPRVPWSPLQSWRCLGGGREGSRHLPRGWLTLVGRDAGSNAVIASASKAARSFPEAAQSTIADSRPRSPSTCSSDGTSDQDTIALARGPLPSRTGIALQTQIRNGSSSGEWSLRGSRMMRPPEVRASRTVSSGSRRGAARHAPCRPGPPSARSAARSGRPRPWASTRPCR